jgi:hypothetical protein
MLYAAYGSNLDHARMMGRCPGAVPAGSARLPGWRLVVNRFATIERDAESSLPIGLWLITPAHRLALDVAEGVALGVYRPVMLELDGHGVALSYIEQRLRPGPPAEAYVAHLRQGYADFGLDPAALDAALARWRDSAASRRVM